MEELIELYANNKLWDSTNCPFGTQTLSKKAYDINMGELDFGKLKKELTSENIKYIETNEFLYVDMSWEDEKDPSDHLIETLTYSYKGYIYYVKMCWTDGCAGYTMSREPQFNKDYL